MFRDDRLIVAKTHSRHIVVELKLLNLPVPGILPGAAAFAGVRVARGVVVEGVDRVAGAEVVAADLAGCFDLHAVLHCAAAGDLVDLTVRVDGEVGEGSGAEEESHKAKEAGLMHCC